MSTPNAYRHMLREMVREQGDPEQFDPTRVQLTGEQMAEGLRYHDHLVGEVADSLNESICSCLQTAQPIGGLLVSHLRTRLLVAMTLDLECAAADMAMENEQDREYEESHV